VLVFEEQGRPGGAQVPGEVVGEHAEQDVRADAGFEVVVDRADLEFGAFERFERALGLLEALVGAHDIVACELCRGL
jgi:hypothetical protein